MHDAQIRVAIAGAGGRMGRQLIQAVQQMDGVALGAALEREGSSSLGAMPVSWPGPVKRVSRCKAVLRRSKMILMC
jgi:dihydrodipicolinate reductase